MAVEFVVFENGMEVDWIDPVVLVREFETQWLVDNGCSTYLIEKAPGRSATVRPLGGVGDPR